MGTKGTMRGSTNAIQGLAQWIGRKVRNHDPLHEIEPKKVTKGTAMTKDQIGITTTLSQGDTILLKTRDGRKFAVIVTEVTGHADPKELETLWA